MRDSWDCFVRVLLVSVLLVVAGNQQLFGRVDQFTIIFLAGFSDMGAGSMQKFIGERVRKKLEGFIWRLTGRQLFEGFVQHLFAHALGGAA